MYIICNEGQRKAQSEYRTRTRTYWRTIVATSEFETHCKIASMPASCISQVPLLVHSTSISTLAFAISCPRVMLEPAVDAQLYSFAVSFVISNVSTFIMNKLTVGPTVIRKPRKYF